MIDVRTVLLPSLLTPDDIEGRAVVVFDVIRATTTITTALANGAAEVRVFDSLDSARDAAGEYKGDKLLAGEKSCLCPPGFDLGNSPSDFSRKQVAGRTIFFCTTNGTRALLAARNAKRLFAGCLRNAQAVAETLDQLQLPVTLLCAGTEGGISIEDTIGCGAVYRAMEPAKVCSAGDAMLVARCLQDLNEISTGKAADNLRQVGLEADIDFCSRFAMTDVVAECDPATMTLRRFSGL